MEQQNFNTIILNNIVQVENISATINMSILSLLLLLCLQVIYAFVKWAGICMQG